MDTEELVMKFWKSWQSPADWEEMRSYMTDEYDFDAGMFHAHNADQSILIAQSGNPWKDIVLLDMICQPNKAAIIYQGTDAETGTRYRVSEFLKIKDGKIQGGYGNVAVLST